MKAKNIKYVRFYPDNTTNDDSELLSVINFYIDDGWTFSGVIYQSQWISQLLMFVKYEKE